MYKKFPVFYNSSIVSSFEPKVIYKVMKTMSEVSLECLEDVRE